MNFRLRPSFFVLLLVSVAYIHPLRAQRAPNTNAYYQQLRGLLPGGEVITVKDFVLQRDAATFTFRSGSVAFYGQVNGKVTGAVFRGEGHIHITPPTPEERHNLSILTHTEQFDEDFDEVVLRFTDSTADQLRKASTGAGQPDSSYARAAQELETFLRHHAERSYIGQGGTYYFKELYGNVDLRLLEDVLSPAPGGYFLAAVHGSKNGHLYFILDPHGVDEVAPEEVALIRWDSMNETETIPLAFHRAAEYVNGTASGNEHNAAYKILHQDLDVTIEKNGFLTSLATAEVQAEAGWRRRGPAQSLSHAARQPGHYRQRRRPRLGAGEQGSRSRLRCRACRAAQERRNHHSQDYLWRQRRRAQRRAVAITILSRAKTGFPTPTRDFGDYATYHMFFHVPKGLQLIATGTKLNESNEGKITTTEWKTETPLPVVGFSLGDFVSKETKIGTPLTGQLAIDAYANKERPDAIANLAQQLSDANQGLGTLDTTPMLANELSQGQVAAQIYTDYFGPLPFPHIALTQQSACDYGQSWPMLVYLPICGFFDSTQRHFLGLSDFTAATYWDVVTPHEVSHQWWGHTVGFRSYRDQWMSEGFAQTSASIFLQLTRPKPDDFIHFWKLQRQLITEKNEFGFRPIDVGPVTMGVRLSSPKAGWNIYQDLVYPKGAYILHMMRMMMWTPKDGDAPFKAMMHDFVKTYTSAGRYHRGLQGHRGKTHESRHGPRRHAHHGLVLPRVRLRHRSARVSL